MADQKRKAVYRCRCRECNTVRDKDVREYHRAINRVMVELDERSRRLFAGLLAKPFGRGGIQLASEITGLSRVTVRRGVIECNQPQPDSDRVRRAGGGRKSVEKKFLK